MFSKQIVQTDAFMDMPISSQLLYFHLAMEADDDGFVSSPKKIMKLLGSSLDDYKILIAKKFIIIFETGICVIKHWLIHNYIRKDTYNETKYLEEKGTLEVKENGSYTQRQLPVDGSSTQVRLGKDRLDKYNIYSEFKNVKLTDEEYKKLVEKLGEKNTQLIIEELGGYIASKGKKYNSHYATLLNWVRKKYQDHQTKLQAKKRTIA